VLGIFGKVLSGWVAARAAVMIRRTYVLYSRPDNYG
jgi:hypothetical protein